MNKSVFYRILTEFKNLPITSKQKLLQEFENELAHFQGRDARSLIFPKKNKGSNGEFKFDEPNNIYVYNIDDVEPIKILETITHEGCHCLTYDFYSKPQKDKKYNFKLICKYDEKKLSKEKKLIDLIYNLASKLDSQDGFYLMSFNLCFYEEQLARTETLYYLMHKIISELENCENKDLEILNQARQNLIDNFKTYKFYADLLSKYYEQLIEYINNNKDYTTFYSSKIKKIFEGKRLTHLDEIYTKVNNFIEINDINDTNLKI